MRRRPPAPTRLYHGQGVSQMRRLFRHWIAGLAVALGVAAPAVPALAQGHPWYRPAPAPNCPSPTPPWLVPGTPVPTPSPTPDPKDSTTPNPTPSPTPNPTPSPTPNPAD